jgi:hypothetical protein
MVVIIPFQLCTFVVYFLEKKSLPAIGRRIPKQEPVSIPPGEKKF